MHIGSASTTGQHHVLEYAGFHIGRAQLEPCNETAISRLNRLTNKTERLDPEPRLNVATTTEQKQNLTMTGGVDDVEWMEMGDWTIENFKRDAK
ncbi:uncharacterized protein N7529_007741 [Penicillium soppii]|uniref:uncharacterized protein n=1 Tax=Penicillium soppii TaxID=69789 RepID=UPI002546C3D9|nr:uncharacterized protein N7529_007741 [Penicillium soppii]KAJ5860431.1 hypothetical protein N7529_007741 [Penicillium soppii]